MTSLNVMVIVLFSMLKLTFSISPLVVSVAYSLALIARLCSIALPLLPAES